MNFVSILFIAIGLAMDAFAVSISCGIRYETIKIRHATRIALFFGVAQALMPLLGWFLGMTFQKYLSAFDHWIAFGLLAFIGIKMLWEAREGCESRTDFFNVHVLFMLAIATSIDAFAVGLSLAILGTDVMTPALIIGLVTFTMSFAGVYLGDKLGCWIGKKVEIAGGVILLLIGLKILLEHLIKNI